MQKMVNPQDSGCVQTQSCNSASTARVRCGLTASRKRTVDVDQAHVGDLQMRDHRQRQEGDLQERLGQRDAQAAGGLRAAGSAGRAPSRRLGRSSARRPAAAARRSTRPPSDHHEAALDLAEAVHRHRHVGVVRADDARCCGCRGRSRRRWRRACRPKPCTKPRPMLPFLPCRSTTATLMTSCARSTPSIAAGIRQRAGEPLGDDAARHDADHRRRRPGPRRGEIGRRDRPRLDAAAPDRRHGARGPRTAPRRRAAPPTDHRRDGAAFEIVEQHEVGAPARRDQAAVAQPEGARGGDRGRGRRRAGARPA